MKRKEAKQAINKIGSLVSWKHPAGKFLRLGPENCTNSELLAILIGSGFLEKPQNK